MKKKIESAKTIIKTISEQYKNPIIYCGFGKDSICVLDLCRDLGLNWPIMYHREIFFPRKKKFANRIIEEWNLRCYDYPFWKVSIFHRFGVIELVRHYQIGSSDMLHCSMLCTPDTFDEEYLCAYEDLVLSPKGSMEYIWDIGLEGSRTGEQKPHTNNEPIGLRWALKQNIGSADIAFPIHDWTGEDIYHYHLERDIPINHDVYDVRDDQLIPKDDYTFNPDKRPACSECINPDNPLTVYCPRKKCMVNNISGQLGMAPMPIDFYDTVEGNNGTSLL